MKAVFEKLGAAVHWVASSVLLVVVLAVVAFLIGFVFRGCWSGAPQEPAHGHEEQEKPPAPEDEEPQWWTCSMHPNIKQPKPGLCPICNMELIPLEEEGGEKASLRTFVTGEAATRLMDLETSRVERKFVTASVRLVGKVTYDETRLSDITAWVGGRIDRLYVDYTGIPVREGDHMVYLYSPELYVAQQELLQAIQAAKGSGGVDARIVRETTQATIEAAREKLRLLGLKPEQVQAVERRGTPSDHVTIYAPTGGIVVKMHAQEGQYVQTGSKIYTLADLSRG
ncbi:MAG: efflux RND transporter periplasmic adaptor subunit, partial [Planctomycetota bacterium]